MPNYDEYLFANLPAKGAPGQRVWVKDKAAFYRWGTSWTVDTEQSLIETTAMPVATSAVKGAGIKILGTPADAAAPVLPAVEAAGVAGTTAVPVVVTTATLASTTLTFVNGLLQSVT